MILWGAVARRPVILLPRVNKSDRMRCITPVQLAIRSDRFRCPDRVMNGPRGTST
jgi:hypothetical protein